LLSLGYTIVTRRYKARHGEIDVIAIDGDDLVFVEVKLRRSNDVVAEEAISSSKRAAMLLAAQQYLIATGGLERAIRFDVIAIQPAGLRHHVDAFRAGD
jgi:putative endonuclease